MAATNTTDDHSALSKTWTHNTHFQTELVLRQDDKTPVGYTGQKRLITLADQDSAPESFHSFTQTPDHGSSLTSTPGPSRKRKRESNDNIGRMIAELKANADCVILGTNTVTPVSWEFQRGLPFRTFTRDSFGRELYTKCPEVLRLTSNISKTDNSSGKSPNSRDEESTRHDNLRKHKRQGSLLEWRNKDRFEEPLRL